MLIFGRASDIRPIRIKKVVAAQNFMWTHTFLLYHFFCPYLTSKITIDRNGQENY
ncbi:MAG: hypothetical protein ACI9P5_000600 [Saprospiraceae bacterium]|jgi:hypothetical protein